MRAEGRVTAWQDDRGFGFITPQSGGERVFFHIKAFARGSRRPAVDDRVRYTLRKDAQGRLQATSLTFTDQPASNRRVHKSRPVWIGITLAFLGIVMVLGVLGRLPHALVLLYVVMSVIAFGAYAFDKSAAQAGRWRTAESTLHLFALAGGWPGALAAQQLLRHKTKKASFLAVFWVTVVANVAGLLWLMFGSGQSLLGQLFEWSALASSWPFPRTPCHIT